MTRKRFVKKLISIGVSRNESNIMARKIIEHGCESYEQYFILAVIVKGKLYDYVNKSFSTISQHMTPMSGIIAEHITTDVPIQMIEYRFPLPDGFEHELS